jgi:hypothetical protein
MLPPVRQQKKKDIARGHSMRVQEHFLACWLALAVSTAQGQFPEGEGVPLPLSLSSRQLPRQQLWHDNAQIKWKPERLFHPEESLSFQYIKVANPCRPSKLSL